MTISEFFKEKYSARKDKDNMYGVGMSDAEFRHFIIEYLLPDAGVSQTHSDSHKSMRLPFMKFLKNILRNSEKSTRNI